MNPSVRVTLGVVLLTMSAVGIVHGIRAGLAQAMYFEAKYGSAQNDPNRIFSLCEKAHGLYPFNYNFCILAAETAYNSSFGMEPAEAARRLALAERWCGTGLKLNFFKSQLRLLKTRLLVMTSVPDAIRYWEDYVRWQFWVPDNHAVRVELYCLSGDFDKALDALEWVKGSGAYEEASRKLQAAWKKDMTVKAPSGKQP